MGEQSLLEMYAAALMRVTERDAMKGRSKSSSGGWKEREWTRQDILYFKGLLDGDEDEIHQCVRLNIRASSQHIANVIYVNRWAFKIPDELWEYIVQKVEYWKDRAPDEDEMFERTNLNDWWVRWEYVSERRRYYKHRSKQQSLVKNTEV